MKIRVVSSKDEIDSLDIQEQMVHLTFRPSNKDIMILVNKCPNLKAIHVASSFMKTISESTKMFLKMQDISLLEGDVWGHRKDINEYYEINPAFFDKVKTFKSEGLSDSEIISRLERESRLDKDLIKFLI
ncbi:MAG: hypothetical protein C00003105_01607 [ANME-2 cluster archaeon HR1]|jgi:hypothetical protein|nr:MAG: hypothetical protein C00003105_01607 [ANME-2 cluster archaeon HR1]